MLVLSIGTGVNGFLLDPVSWGKGEGRKEMWGGRVVGEWGNRGLLMGVVGW